MAKTAFVVEAYLPRGGAYMAYQVARILHEEFGYDVRVLSSSDTASSEPSHGRFEYQTIFRCLPLEECEAVIGDDDVVICNPSFSDLNLGTRVRGFKIMYCQGFTTFRLPDLSFDHYVAVSGFVADFLHHTYKLYAPVIPAFIWGTSARREASADWADRRPSSIVLNIKGDQALLAQQRRLLLKLRELLAANDRELSLSIDWGEVMQMSAAPLPHDRFLDRLASSRFLLTLSIAEGLGLVPLEAMAMGTVVVGFDGFGGREYMMPGVNCEVVEYPDLRRLAERMVVTMRDQGHARRLAEAGGATASRYTYEAFRAAWVAELTRVLPR